MLSSDLVNTSNMLNLSEHKRRKELQSAYKKLGSDKLIKVPDGGESFLEEIEDGSDHKKSAKNFHPLHGGLQGNLLDDLESKEFDLLEMVLKKFNMSGSDQIK